TIAVRYLPIDKPTVIWGTILARQSRHEYYSDHHGDWLFLRTTAKGARRVKLVSAPAADPRRENWKEVIPHRPGVMLSGVEFFKDFYVVSERGNATPVLRIYNLQTKQAAA